MADEPRFRPPPPPADPLRAVRRLAGWLLRLPGRLRLWHQFALVGLLATGLPLAFVAYQFYYGGQGILRDHEVIDLGDEANLRATDIRDDVQAVLRVLAAAARAPARRSDPLARFDWPTDPPTGSTAPRRGYLSVALVGRAVVPARAADRAVWVGDGPRGPGPLADLLERMGLPDPCYVGKVHADGDRLLLPVGRWVYPPDGGRPAAALVAVLDLTKYLDARSRADARHLYLLTKPDGTVLYHPQRELVGQPLAAVGWPTADPDVAAALADDMATRPARLARLAETGGVRLRPPPTRLGDLSPFPTLRFRFLKGGLPGGAEFAAHVPDAVNKLTDLTRTLEKLDGVRAAPPGLRGTYLELAADRLDTLDAARRTVEAWWSANAPGSLRWAEVDCKTFHGQLVPLRLDPADPDEPVRLVVAAGEEELTQDIADKFWAIVKWGVLPVLALAAVAAGLVVWAITRSLRYLAWTAEHLSAVPTTGTGVHAALAADDPPPPLTSGGSVEVVQLTASLTALYDRLNQANANLETRVKVRTAELAEANGKLETAVQEARTAARAKDAFLANMSHELRNPLHIILGFADELRDVVEESGRPDLTPDLDKIRKAGKHLLQLINDILDLAKIEAGKMDLSLAPVSVRAVVNEVRQLVEPLAAVNKNRLVVDAPPGLGRVTTDDKRLKQILINLLSNAFKFTDRGVVTLTAGRVRDGGKEWVRLAIRDTGKGMTPAQVGRLFERFYQADDTTTRQQGGTGLGLSICQALADRLGCKPIAVTSQPGKGSEFVLFLPADAADSAAAKRRTSGLAAQTTVADQSIYADGTQTVLVIDDDAQVRELMERFLSREGFAVRTAGTAADGLRLARLLRPACITLDVMMPGTDGWQALTELKSHPATADIPVVMLTIADDRSRGFALGAADYLTKPIDWPRLAAILKRFQQAGAARPVLVVDDDPECRELVGRHLEGHGWRFTEAADGDEGLTVAAADPPAVVLLDLMMPGTDGFAFLDALPRRFPAGPPPVVVLTAKELTPADLDRLTGRVSSILAKGDLSHLDELLARVRAAAGGR